MTDSSPLQRKLERERAARKEAERLLEEKSRELYHAHMEVEKSAEAFRDNATRLSAIMDNVPATILTLDASGVIEACNRETEARFGAAASMFVGQHISALFQGVDTPGNLAGLGKSSPEATKVELGILRDAVCLRPDGSTFPSEYALTEVKHADKHYWIVFLRDISKRKEAEKRRAELEIEVRQAQKLEALGTLSGGIAHEINTPIQYLGDNIHFLRDASSALLSLVDKYQSAYTAESPEARKVVLAEAQEIADSVDVEFLRMEVPTSLDNSTEGIGRIREIVQAIKRFSHPDQTEMSALNLNDAIKTTATVSKAQWKNLAELSFELDPELPNVSAMPGEINQVILNLIMNAAHAIEDAKRGPPGMIVVSTRRAGNNVEFSVRDNGIGIPKENLAKIFDPFFTTKEPGRGTGQGMSIVHSIVTKTHNGTFAIDSEPGEGTMMTVSLPISDVEVARRAS